MGDAEAMKEHLLDQIAEVHDRYVELMGERLPELGQREIELYLGIVGKLVAKLEQRDKPIRTAAQEMFTDVAAVVMAEMGR